MNRWARSMIAIVSLVRVAWFKVIAGPHGLLGPIVAVIACVAFVANKRDMTKNMAVTFQPYAVVATPWEDKMNRYICAGCAEEVGGNHSVECTIGSGRVEKGACTIVWNTDGTQTGRTACDEQEASTEQAVIELHKLIYECEGDTLAALYEYAFAHVENAHYDDETGTIYFTPSEN